MLEDYYAEESLRLLLFFGFIFVAGCPKTEDNVWGHLSDTGMDVAHKSVLSDFYNMNLNAWNSINNNINCMFSSGILGHLALQEDWSLRDSQLWKLQRLCKC